MPLYLIEPPEQDEVLTLADAKQHLRVDFEDDDDVIESYIAAAIQSIDGRDGWLGRALVEQTWELRLPDFGGSVIPIPLPPLITIESIKYYDAVDMLQTLSPDVYEVTGVGGFGKRASCSRAARRGRASANEARMSWCASRPVTRLCPRRSSRRSSARSA